MRVITASATDDQIIAALVADENTLLRAVYGSGLTEQAVNQRASELGLTRDVIKRCRLAGTTPALRKCIKCDATFLSSGKHNRLCVRCPAR